MKTIGFRCWENKLAWVALKGTRDMPVVIASAFVKSPGKLARPAELQWLRREVADILLGQAIDRAFFRQVEGMSRNAATASRFECHGVLQEAWFATRPGAPIEGRVAGQIKRDLQYKGLAKELVDEFIIGTALEKLPLHFRDALLVGLCGL